MFLEHLFIFNHRINFRKTIYDCITTNLFFIFSLEGAIWKV